MKKILKITSHLLSLMRYPVWGINFLLFLGIVGVLFGVQRSHWMFTFDYGDSIINVPIIFPLVILILLIIILVFIIQLLKIWSKLLFGFSKGQFFSVENLKKLKRSMIFLVLVTAIQLLINLIFNYLSVENVSEVFDFSLKNYVVHSVFILFNAILIIVLEKGKNIQKENEDFI